MRRTTYSAASLLALLLCAGNTQSEPSSEIALRPIKYSELGKMVRALKGKVVVVDFWAEY
jgi:hypothetical protein